LFFTTDREKSQSFTEKKKLRGSLCDLRASVVKIPEEEITDG
jgi:hypothetical protein